MYDAHIERDCCCCCLCVSQRAVARISVVGGGDKLRITTHKFFGVRGAQLFQCVLLRG